MTDHAVNNIEIPVLYKQALYSYWNEDHKRSIEQIGLGLESCDLNQQALFTSYGLRSSQMTQTLCLSMS